MGYAKFFNEKYDRSGYLWQGRYKKILIETDAHFNYIPYYIHLNPLDRLHKQWRVGGVTDCTKALDVLDTYRWSSYLDYQGTKKLSFSTTYSVSQANTRDSKTTKSHH